MYTTTIIFQFQLNNMFCVLYLVRCKNVVTPVRKQWSYCNFVLSRPCVNGELILYCILQRIHMNIFIHKILVITILCF